MKDYLRATMDFRVAVDETDAFGRVKPSALLQYMQDLATEHALDLGIGFHDMLARGFVWVLTKVRAKIFDYPRIGECIRAETFPHAPGNAECVRDFYLYRASGELFACASTVWCVIDANSRRVCRAKDFFSFSPDVYKPECAAEMFRRLELPETEPVYEAEAMYAEIDRNGHLNNARYGDMMLNACPEELLNRGNIAEFDMHFMHETKKGERCRVRRAVEDATVYTDADREGTRLFAAAMRFAPRTEGIL